MGKGAGTVSYVDTYRTSPDGESLLYTANSPFSSIPAESSPAYTRYIGRRGADGWNNRPLDPPYDAGTGTGAAFDITGVIGSSYNLDYVLVSSTYALTPGATEGGGNLYMRDTRSNELKLVATSPNRVLSSVFTGLLGPTAVNYVAPDGKAAIFTAPVALVPGAPEGSGNALAYSWSESGGIELLSQLPNGEIVTGGGGGNGSENGSRESMAYEGGLDHTYFSYVNESGFQGVFVRSGGVSKAVSYSRIPGDPPGLVPAIVDAVASGGRYMLFHTVGFDGRRLTADTPEIRRRLGRIPLSLRRAERLAGLHRHLPGLRQSWCDPDDPGRPDDRLRGHQCADQRRRRGTAQPLRLAQRHPEAGDGAGQHRKLRRLDRLLASHPQRQRPLPRVHRRLRLAGRKIRPGDDQPQLSAAVRRWRRSL